MGWRSEAIERQKAHGVSDSVRRHYNYAQHLSDRRMMMQAWADYLDGLRLAQGAHTSITVSQPTSTHVAEGLVTAQREMFAWATNCQSAELTRLKATDEND